MAGNVQCFFLTQLVLLSSFPGCFECLTCYSCGFDGAEVRVISLSELSRARYDADETRGTLLGGTGQLYIVFSLSIADAGLD